MATVNDYRRVLSAHLLAQSSGMEIEASGDGFTLRPDVERWPKYAKSARFRCFATVDEVVAFLAGFTAAMEYEELGDAEI